MVIKTSDLRIVGLHGGHGLDYKGKSYDHLLRPVGPESKEIQLLQDFFDFEDSKNKSAQEIWKVVLGELRLRVTGAFYRTWLEKTSGLSYHLNQFVVAVPNIFVAEYFARDQRSLIEKILAGLTHPGIKVYFQQNICRAISERETITIKNESSQLHFLPTQEAITIKSENSQPHSLPTQEAIDKFLKAKKGKLKPDSIISYGAALRAFARAYPELPLEPEQIEAYLDNFNHENTTAQYKFSVLRTFYFWLSRRNLIAVNPIKMVEKPAGQADEVLPLNEKQVRLLHDEPKTNREQGYIGLMLDHGFRLSEVIRLDVGDIHEDRIWVHGKARKEFFPLLSEVRDWLLKLADGRGPGEPLFVSRQGRLSASQIQSDIKRLLQRAGINGVRQSPHTLRHTFSTLAYLAGCDWDAVELLLRQKERKRNVTNRYIHLSPEQRLELMRERLERYSPLRIVAEPSWAKSQITPSSTAVDTNFFINLINNAIALGEAAKELKHQLGGNGHQPEQQEEIKGYLDQARK